MVRGKARSYRNVSHIHKVDFVWDKLLTSTLDPSRDALPGGAGDSSSPFVTVERFDFLPGMICVVAGKMADVLLNCGRCLACRLEKRNALFFFDDIAGLVFLLSRLSSAPPEER